MRANRMTLKHSRCLKVQTGREKLKEIQLEALEGKVACCFKCRQGDRHPKRLTGGPNDSETWSSHVTSTP